jgi:hypothetical protein
MLIRSNSNAFPSAVRDIGMSLDELTEDVTDEYSALDDDFTISLDRETKNELAMLAAAFDTDDPAELIRRGVHLLYRQTVDSGDLDFHLRSGYDVTYDEYLSGMTYDEMTGGDSLPSLDDSNRYRM